VRRAAFRPWRVQLVWVGRSALYGPGWLKVLAVYVFAPGNPLCLAPLGCGRLSRCGRVGCVGWRLPRPRVSGPPMDRVAHRRPSA